MCGFVYSNRVTTAAKRRRVTLKKKGGKNWNKTVEFTSATLSVFSRPQTRDVFLVSCFCLLFFSLLTDNETRLTHFPPDRSLDLPRLLLQNSLQFFQCKSKHRVHAYAISFFFQSSYSHSSHDRIDPTDYGYRRNIYFSIELCLPLITLSITTTTTTPSFALVKQKWGKVVKKHVRSEQRQECSESRLNSPEPVQGSVETLAAATWRRPANRPEWRDSVTESPRLSDTATKGSRTRTEFQLRKRQKNRGT